MTPTVYVETSIVSYLAAQPSRDLITAVHRVDYLLTWNCAHRANAGLRVLVERACAKQGYMAPTMCTPEELMEEVGYDD